MGTRETVKATGTGRPSLVGVASTAGLAGLSVIGWSAGLRKVLVVAWVAFLAMAVGAALGARSPTTVPRRLVWGYGLAAGAMITSAAIFLVPQAMGYHPTAGGFGIAAGLLVGYAGHTVGHRLSHLDTPFDTTAAQLSAHALAAGAIIGLTYAVLPELSLLLGLAIVSHKGPAAAYPAGPLWETIASPSRGPSPGIAV